MKIIELAGTCSGLGALTVTSTRNIVGYIEKIEMVYADGATGSDVTITEEGTVTQTLLVVANAGVADLTWYPRILSNLNTDASELASVEGNKPFITGTLKVVIAQGGANKAFRFLVYLSDEC